MNEEDHDLDVIATQMLSALESMTGVSSRLPSLLGEDEPVAICPFYNYLVCRQISLPGMPDTDELAVQLIPQIEEIQNVYSLCRGAGASVYEALCSARGAASDYERISGHRILRPITLH